MDKKFVNIMMERAGIADDEIRGFINEGKKTQPKTSKEEKKMIKEALEGNKAPVEKKEEKTSIKKYVLKESETNKMKAVLKNSSKSVVKQFVKENKEIAGLVDSYKNKGIVDLLNNNFKKITAMLAEAKKANKAGVVKKLEKISELIDSAAFLYSRGADVFNKTQIKEHISNFNKLLLEYEDMEEEKEEITEETPAMEEDEMTSPETDEEVDFEDDMGAEGDMDDMGAEGDMGDMGDEGFDSDLDSDMIDNYEDPNFDDVSTDIEQIKDDLATELSAAIEKAVKGISIAIVDDGEETDMGDEEGMESTISSDDVGEMGTEDMDVEEPAAPPAGEFAEENPESGDEEEIDFEEEETEEEILKESKK